MDEQVLSLSPMQNAAARRFDDPGDAHLSPMMKQYQKIKEKYRYCIVLFRLGDFYEMFFEDALIASRELDLTLTARDSGGGNRAPMCGVPAVALDSYVAKLIEKGYKVAVCEQSNAANADKKLMRREVTRVVTPGTLTEPTMLEPSRNNYIAAVFEDIKGGAGFALSDISTGAFFAFSAAPQNGRDVKITDELSPFNPSEIIVNERFSAEREIISAFGVKAEKRGEWSFEAGGAFVRLCNRFGVLNLSGYGFDEDDKRDALAIRAAGALLSYLEETQKGALSQIIALKKYTRDEFLVIDAQSRLSLELTTGRKSPKKNTLLSVIDKTKTAMGARLLRARIESPLRSVAEINARLNAVETFKNADDGRDAVRALLGGVGDIERLMAKVSAKSATGRDLAALRSTVSILPEIKRTLAALPDALLRYIGEEADDFDDVYDYLERAIADEPPALLKDGGVIKDGYNEELDAYRSAKRDGSVWLLELENRERNETGIKNLKIKYNRVFGYFFEISRANKTPLPERFGLRQTLATAQRYSTEELQKIETAILTADDKISEREYTLFCEVRDYVAENMERLLTTAALIANADVLSALAVAAAENGYVKPIVDGGDSIEIVGGRHPVVEKFADEGFVKNDLSLGGDERISVITGPNMAGKSTYMRQSALICVLAQAGSFVPADYAKIGVIDKIFTRVGASDDIAGGRSTFMVEMSEVANIVHNATPDSLLILDEIGRGTSTYDGLSIAWAVLEYIAEEIGAKTLFATHYHELTELEGKTKGVVNYSAAVKEQGKNIVFLRKIERGRAKGSYGVSVARLAGLPEKITARADGILESLAGKK